VSKAVIELIGIVEETFPNATFRVRILSDQAKDHELLCHLAGRMRKFRVRILPGDRVKIEMTPYDLSKGRIVYRFRSDQLVPELEEEKKLEAEKKAAEAQPEPEPQPDSESST
jgi:translation initiation factor IF-1